MKTLSFVFIFFALSCLSTAEAQSCDGSDQEIRDCWSVSLQKADDELNMVYQMALKVVKDSYTPADAQNLKDAERKWIAYRDAGCRAERGLWGGGTGGIVTYTMCLFRATQRRTIDLRKTYLQH